MKLIQSLWHRFQEDEVMDLAAQCAYYLLLSLFPFLIFVITLMGYLPISATSVLDQLALYAPSLASELIESTLIQIFEVRNTGLLSFSVLVTIWSASNGINALIRALNKAYKVPIPRSFWRARLVSIGLTAGMIIVMVVALTFIVFGHMIGQFMHDFLGVTEQNVFFWELLRIAGGFIVINFIFTILYKFGPHTSLTVREVIYGSLIATLGWQLTSFGFAYYVNQFATYSATYGSLGGVIVLMLWFYISAMILIIGGEINALLKEKKASPSA